MLEPTSQYFDFDDTPSVNDENKGGKQHNLAVGNRIGDIGIVFPEIFWQKDAFTQTDLVSTEDNRAQELIHQIRKSLLNSSQDKLANELVTLFKLAKEESPSKPGISSNSLSSFYDFLLSFEIIKVPILSLTPDHHIYASWRGDARLFSAHFLPHGDFRFVLFMPNDKHPNRKIRITGTASADILKEIISLENLADWAIRERG